MHNDVLLVLFRCRRRQHHIQMLFGYPLLLRMNRFPRAFRTSICGELWLPGIILFGSVNYVLRLTIRQVPRISHAILHLWIGGVICLIGHIMHGAGLGGADSPHRQGVGEVDKENEGDQEGQQPHNYCIVYQGMGHLIYGSQHQTAHDQEHEHAQSQEDLLDDRWRGSGLD